MLRMFTRLIGGAPKLHDERVDKARAKIRTIHTCMPMATPNGFMDLRSKGPSRHALRSCEQPQ